MGVILFPFLANYLFLGGDRSRLHYIISCAALAYLLIVYVNIFLTYLNRKRLEQYLEPFIGRFYQKNTALPGYLASWLIVTVIIAVIKTEIPAVFRPTFWANIGPIPKYALIVMPVIIVPITPSGVSFNNRGRTDNSQTGSDLGENRLINFKPAALYLMGGP